MNSCEPLVHTSAELAAQIVRALPYGGVPLLVLRIPAVARTLEQLTASVFVRAAQRVVRDGDRLAHDPGGDWFAFAMLTPSRNGSQSLSLDARSALERIAATMSLVTGTRMETGWWPIESPRDLQPLERTIERALERGARERERFEFLATVGHELRTPANLDLRVPRDGARRGTRRRDDPAFSGSRAQRGAAPRPSGRRNSLISRRGGPCSGRCARAHRARGADRIARRRT